MQVGFGGGYRTIAKPSSSVVLCSGALTPSPHKPCGQGFLSYLGTRALESTDSPKLATVEPATASYRDEL